MEYEWAHNLAFFFGLLILFMLSGMPVAFGFLTLNIVGLYLFLGEANSLSLLATSSFSSIGQFALIPIPLFILMGELLMRTGLASKTVEAVDQWIGRVPGRLSLSAVGGGTLFGALSGASMASVAMLGSTLVLAAGYGRLTLETLRLSLMATTTTTAMMPLVIVGSTGFSQILAATGSTSGLVSMVTELDLSPLLTVIIMQAIVLFLGCFIDTISIMLVAVPVFLPIVLALGLDPIWFCILILVQLELAGITPPFGVLLFVMKGVQQHLPISQIYRAALPIVAIQIGLVIVLSLFPAIVTTLPNLVNP